MSYNALFCYNLNISYNSNTIEAIVTTHSLIHNVELQATNYQLVTSQPQHGSCSLGVWDHWRSSIPWILNPSSSSVAVLQKIKPPHVICSVEHNALCRPLFLWIPTGNYIALHNYRAGQTPSTPIRCLQRRWRSNNSRILWIWLVHDKSEN